MGYSDLIQHLMASSSAGDKAQWREHAEAIRRSLHRKGANADFDVETRSADGSSHIRSQQTSTDDGKGTVTKKTVTQSTHTETNSVGGQLPIGGGKLPQIGAQAQKAKQAMQKAANNMAEQM